jgi:hypothetical protein
MNVIQLSRSNARLVNMTTYLTAVAAGLIAPGAPPRAPVHVPGVAPAPSGN